MRWNRAKAVTGMQKVLAILLSVTLAAMMLPAIPQQSARAEMASGRVTAQTAPDNVPEGARPLDMTMHEGLNAQASSEPVTGLVIGRDYTLVVDPDLNADIENGYLMWVKTDSMGNFLEDPLEGIEETGSHISGYSNIRYFSKFGIHNRYLSGEGTSVMPVGNYRLFYYAHVYNSETRMNTLATYYSKQQFTVSSVNDESVLVKATDSNGASVAAFTDLGENHTYDTDIHAHGIPKYTIEAPASNLTGAYLEAVDEGGNPLASQYTHLPDPLDFDTSTVGVTKIPILEFSEFRYTAIYPSESGTSWSSLQEYCAMPPGTYRFCFYDAAGVRYLSQVFAFGEGVNVIGKASEPLVVHVPQSITSKATLPASARLVTVKDGAEAAFWSGAIKDTITIYAFPKGEYDGAALQVLLNGKYTTIARYEGVLSRGSAYSLSTDGCTDFWYVPRVDVLDGSGAVVVGSEYKMTITGADHDSWNLPGFMAAQDYMATLAMSGSSNVYGFAEFNEGSGNTFSVNEEGAFSVSALNVRAPSANVGVTVSDPENNPLEGVRVTASQTLVNGCAYNVSALTDASGACSFTLWTADSIMAGTKTSYTLSYGGHLVMEGENFAESNTVYVDTQATGATKDFRMGKRNPSRVDFSWTTRCEQTDAATLSYLNDLPRTFTLSGSIDGTRLANTFEGESDRLYRYGEPAVCSAGYDLWSDADIRRLVTGGKTLGLAMESEAYHMGADAASVQLDGENCGQFAFELVPRAGVHASLTADTNKAMGPCVAWWFDSAGTFIGASEQVAMVGDWARPFSFVAPRNESGAYTVAFAPQSAVEPVRLADIASDGDISLYPVNLVADAAVELGSVGLGAASARNARYILQPNSSVSAPDRWANAQELIAVNAHLEADGDAQGATITHLEFIANEGAALYWQRTFTIGYVTGDFDGDGERERKAIDAANLAGAHHTDQAFLEFDEPVALPLDITAYGTPEGDADIKLTVTADVAYSKDGQVKTSRDDLVGTVTIAKPSATITAPARTANESIRVSGVARAGASVRIFDGGTLVGTASADWRGTWKADVQLVGCSDAHASLHMVYAMSGDVKTDAVDVVHNARGAALKRSGMYLNGTYLDAAESYMWYPSYDRYGREVKLEAEIANPGALKPTSAIVAEAASLAADDLLAQPVVFGVEFLNGDVRYFKGEQTATGSEVFQSEAFKTYSPITSIAVLYENDESNASFYEKDGDGYDAVEVSSAEFLADLNAESQGSETETYKDVLKELEEQGATFTWVTDELGEGAGKLSAPRLMEMHRALKAADSSDVSFTLSGLETASAFEEDLKYAKARAKDAPDTASLTTGTVGATDNAGGYYKVYNFNESRDTDADGTFDTDFAMQLVESHDTSDGQDTVLYSAFASFESAVDAPLPGLEGLSTLEAQSTASAASTLTPQAWKFEIPREWYCSDEDIQRSKSFTEAVGSGDLNQALYIYCVNEIPELETYLRNNDWQMMADSLRKDLDDSRFTPCFKHLSEAEKDRQREYVNEFNDIVRKYQNKMNNKARLSIGWGIGCRVVSKAGTTKELGGLAARFNSNTAKQLGDSIKATGDAASKVNSSSIDADFAGLMQQYKLYKFRVKRVETNAGLKSGDSDCTDLPKNKISAVTKSHPNIDPSGYVYEAVASNRVEDATVTLYESVGGVKTPVESESDVIMGEKNPLATDARGHYEWFVPAGLWLVEVDKVGYESADSQNLPNIPAGERQDENGLNWLKVPPPQTEVNIGMTSKEAPYLKNVYAAPDGVRLEFSRYMDESTLTAGAFTLKDQSDSDIACAVELLDSEASPAAAATSHASKVLLKASLSGARVVKVAVNESVKSYAGTEMGIAYENVLDVKETYTLSMQGGTAAGSTEVTLPEGTQVQIAADAAQAGVTFERWSASAGALGDAASAVTTFTMPASNATVKATFAGQARGVRDAAYDNASTSADGPAPGDPADGPAPGDPGEVAAVSAVSKLALANAAKGVQLTWKADATSSTVSGYEIWRSKGSGSWKRVATVSGAATKKYTDKKATAKGARYRYRVRAYRLTDGAYAYGAYSAVATTYRVGKATVKSLTPGSKKLTVRMTKKASAYGAKGFQVAYRVKGASKWRSATSSAPKRVVKKLVSGKRYQVKVRAFKKVGKTKYYGAWSAAKLSKRVK